MQVVVGKAPLKGDAGEKGGVQIAHSASDAADEAKKMLGRTLVTHQTGPAGKQVNRIYIEDGADIARELYLALFIETVKPAAFRLSVRRKAAWILKRSRPKHQN